MASELRVKTQNAIDELRNANEACSLALLIDGDTGLVLCKSSDATVSQNELDDLAADAQKQRKDSLLKSMTEASAKPSFLSSIQIEKKSITAVMAPAAGGDDTLICQFDSMPDRTALFNSARAIFDLTNDAEAA